MMQQACAERGRQHKIKGQLHLTNSNEYVPGKDQKYAPKHAACCPGSVRPTSVTAAAVQQAVAYSSRYARK